MYTGIFVTEEVSAMPAKSKLASHTSSSTSKKTHSHDAPAKVYRTPLRIMAAVPMPGLEPEDITVEVAAAAHLILRGQRRGELKGIKDELLNEWGVGDYYRKVTLPAPVDGSLANVTYGNGVLVVALPIAARTKTATLTLAAQSPTHGLRAGHMGKPIRPYVRAQ
jgi:HSP20 family protein